MAPPTHDRGVSDLSPTGTELRLDPVSFAGMNVDVGRRSQPPGTTASFKGCYTSNPAADTQQAVRTTEEALNVGVSAADYFGVMCFCRQLRGRRVVHEWITQPRGLRGERQKRYVGRS